MTRAEERLTLTLALARRKRGRLKDTHASRFLFEMTGKVPATAKNALRPQVGR